MSNRNLTQVEVKAVVSALEQLLREKRRAYDTAAETVRVTGYSDESLRAKSVAHGEVLCALDAQHTINMLLLNLGAL